jgi:hypothetical protein
LTAGTLLLSDSGFPQVWFGQDTVARLILGKVLCGTFGEGKWNLCMLRLMGIRSWRYVIIVAGFLYCKPLSPGTELGCLRSSSSAFLFVVTLNKQK